MSGNYNYAWGQRDFLLSTLLIEKIVMDHGHAATADKILCKQAGIEFESEAFCIIMMDIIEIDVSHDYSVSNPKTNMAEKTLEALKEAVSGEFLFFPFFHSNDIFALINAKHSFRSLDEMIVTLSGRLRIAREKLLRENGITLQIIISRPVKGLEALNETFHGLYQVVDIQHLHPARNPVSTPFDLDEELSESVDYKNKRKIELERMIIDSAAAHDFDTTYSAFCELLDFESGQYGLSLSINSRLCSRIEVLFDLLGMPHYSYGQYASALDSINWIRASITLDELKSSVHKILSDFADYFEPADAPRQNTAEQVARYIEENYYDHSLSVEALSGIFNISLSYLSRMFKSKHGVRLIDFTHMVRVEKARELLLTTDKTVEQVGNEVGYLNKLTFSRAFKRFEGKTPGAYRGDARS